MKKKQETRGRKPKEHQPIEASFGNVIKALADSSYTPEKKLKAKKKRK